MGSERSSVKTRRYEPILGIAKPADGGSTLKGNFQGPAPNSQGPALSSQGPDLSSQGPASKAAALFGCAQSDKLIELTVIIPARNESANLPACLGSLVSQSESIFELGCDWELIVVDDHSTDATRQIAAGFAGVTVLEAVPLVSGWTGKCNALWTAARQARGRWLLFTDADTVHERGDLRRALHEAQRYEVGMLSYSPRQIVAGFAQRALMPLIFSELALAYLPSRVSDPNDPLAAANGQFLLVEREIYVHIGGHKAVANKVLEDVELAVLAKRSQLGLRFRYAPDALSTRMYRTTEQMVEGWTKNLALLFANCRALAAWRALDLLMLFGLPVLSLTLRARPVSYAIPWLSAGVVVGILWIRTVFRFYHRVLKSNFPLSDCLLAPLGLPLMVVLLNLSWYQHHVRKQVSWKGRMYSER